MNFSLYLRRSVPQEWILIAIRQIACVWKWLSILDEYNNKSNVITEKSKRRTKSYTAPARVPNSKIYPKFLYCSVELVVYPLPKMHRCDWLEIRTGPKLLTYIKMGIRRANGQYAIWCWCVFVVLSCLVLQHYRRWW